MLVSTPTFCDIVVKQGASKQGDLREGDRGLDRTLRCGVGASVRTDGVMVVAVLWGQTMNNTAGLEVCCERTSGA